jgi:hypothetical protein
MLIYFGHGSDEKPPFTVEIQEQKSLANISLYSIKERNCKKNEYIVFVKLESPRKAPVKHDPHFI